MATEAARSRKMKRETVLRGERTVFSGIVTNAEHRPAMSLARTYRYNTQLIA